MFTSHFETSFWNMKLKTTTKKITSMKNIMNLNTKKNHNHKILINGCNHNPMSQKGCQTTKKNNQNWIYIYVLLFKAIAIMASYYFSIDMNVKEFKLKIHLMNFKFKFWFKTFKSEQQHVGRESILQRIIKNIHIIKHIWWKKI